MSDDFLVFKTIDDYINQCPTDIQPFLNTIRETIRMAAPMASERITYQMPTFYLNGNLVHFAAYKHHIGFYPTPSAILAFNNELSPYKTSKGAIQFPLTHPLPTDLIRRIVVFRVHENLKKSN